MRVNVSDRNGKNSLRLLALGMAVAAIAACGAPGGENHGRPSTPASSSSSSTSGVVTHLNPDALASAVTGRAVTGHIRALQSIADAHGGNRAAGTPGYDASVDHVAQTLRDAGFDVTTPRFDFPRFDAGTTTLTADAADVRATPLQYTRGTDGRPVSAPPRTVDRVGCAPGDYPADSRGAVVVVGRGECTFTRKADLATAAGAVGMVVVNSSDDPLAGATLGPDNNTSIPVVGVDRGAGDRLRDARSVTLSTTARTTTVTSRSVIAQTRTGARDDVVMAGAHLDSVDAGPGINDNATGTAAVLETALRMGPTPSVSRGVRFAFWGAEEEGLIGSGRYVESLDDDARESISAYLNFDMLGSPNAGFFVLDGDDSDKRGAGPGPSGSDRIEAVFRRFYEGRRIPTAPADLVGRSDYAPFAEAGIPIGGTETGAEQRKSADEAQKWGGRAGAPFDPNYHSARDTVDNVNTDALEISASGVGHAVATCALSSGPEIC